MTDVVYNCEQCQFHTKNKNNWNRHILTGKHKNNAPILLTEQAVQHAIRCDACDYTCYQMYDYTKHVLTQKHIKLNTKKYFCEHCNKRYANASGVWKHMKTCDKIENTEKAPIKDTKTSEIENKEKAKIENTELDNAKKAEIKDISSMLTAENFMFLLNQNQELQNLVLQTNTSIINTNNAFVEQGKQMLEVCKNNQVANNTTHTNSHNNTNNFNLQFFLNDTCKDALNFSEFMNSIVLNLDDLENTGRLGYVNGISRIFINALRNTELERRPLHCTDVKRETVYFKEEDKWEKDTNDKDTVKRGIQYLADKNMSKIKDWKEQNPKSLETNTPESEELTKLYTAVICADEEQETNKIMRNVLKEVTVKTKLREIEV